VDTSNPSENLVFDIHTIRLLIGVIALSFPLVVYLFAPGITPSISWSYHTHARDLFVGLLFVIGAFLVSYKGHQPTLQAQSIGKFWNWVSRFWNGAIKFRIWEKKNEEDLVSLIGGLGAWGTALCPTAFEVKCRPTDVTSIIHSIAAAILFSTIVYFCLGAFMSQAKKKRDKAEKDGLLEKRGTDPWTLRIVFYTFCGWGIAVIMVGSIVLVRTGSCETSNILFWSEAAALELFGIGWLVASRYLPVVTHKTERLGPIRSRADKFDKGPMRRT